MKLTFGASNKIYLTVKLYSHLYQGSDSDSVLWYTQNSSTAKICHILFFPPETVA